MARLILVASSMVACIVCLYARTIFNPYIFKNILFSLFLNRHTTSVIDPTVETLESDFQPTVIQS